MQPKRRTAIIKAVGDQCNLRCTYCFYHGLNQKTPKVLSLELLEHFFEQYFAIFSGEMSFVWHGGEPLLLGIRYYEAALALQEKYKKSGDVVVNLIQTNATLITDEWARFFKANDFRVGVSIDGTKEKHNKQRPNAGGRGSFDDVVRGIEILRKNGVFPGVIQTVLRSGVSTLADDISFFADKEELKSFGLNFFMDGSSQSNELSAEGIRNEDVVEAYTILFEEWLKRDDAKLSIREIENAIAGVSGHRPKNCSFNGACACYFCLDADGLIWPCDRLSSDKKHLLGDLKEESLLHILDGPASSAHAVCAETVALDCVSCKWRSACNNGCTAMRDEATGKYIFCKARLEIFEAVNDLLSSNQNGHVPTDMSAGGTLP